jgi:hypothetical protein
VPDSQPAELELGHYRKFAELAMPLFLAHQRGRCANLEKIFEVRTKVYITSATPFPPEGAIDLARPSCPDSIPRLSLPHGGFNSSRWCVLMTTGDTPKSSRRALAVGDLSMPYTTHLLREQVYQSRNAFAIEGICSMSGVCVY